MYYVHVEKFGSGRPLVLIHGWGLSSAIWQNLTHELALQYQVIHVDIPGFGKSRPTPQANEYTIENLAALIARVIPDSSIVLGWSMGGLIAQQIALLHPAKVEALLLVATSPYFVANSSWFGIKPNVLKMFKQQLAASSKQTIDRFLAIQAMGSDTAKDDIKQIRASLQNQAEPCNIALTEGLKLLENTDLRISIAAIQQPVLRLFGRLDSLIPFRVIEQIAQLQQNADIVIIEKASHAPFISHKKEFLDNLSKFLAKHGLYG